MIKQRYKNGKLKYKRVQKFNHPRTNTTGTVYVHVLVMEKVLGRYLTKEEVVHHIDGDSFNNSPENLLVFRTNGDHTRFHNTNVLVSHDDGTYSSPEIEIVTCLVCNKEISRHTDSQLCRPCFLLNLATKIPTKEMLEIDILNLSFVAIGKKYGVSDNAVRKWCKKYSLPVKYQEIKLLRKVS